MQLSEILQLVNSGVNFSVLAIVFYLFVSGKLHSDDEMRVARADLDSEKKAHEMTRSALAIANARADTSALTGEIIMRALKGPEGASA